MAHFTRQIPTTTLKATSALIVIALAVLLAQGEPPAPQAPPGARPPAGPADDESIRGSGVLRTVLLDLSGLEAGNLSLRDGEIVFAPTAPASTGEEPRLVVDDRGQGTVLLPAGQEFVPRVAHLSVSTPQGKLRLGPAQVLVRVSAGSPTSSSGSSDLLRLDVLRAPGPASIEVVIEAPGARPGPSATLSVTSEPARGDLGLPWMRRTEPDGVARFAALHTGRTRVRVLAVDGGFVVPTGEDRIVEALPGAVVRIRIEVHPGATLAVGVIGPDASSRARLRLALYRLDAMQHRWDPLNVQFSPEPTPGEADQPLRLTARSLEPGLYRVVLRVPEHRSTSAEVRLVPGESALLELRQGDVVPPIRFRYAWPEGKRDSIAFQCNRWDSPESPDMAAGRFGPDQAEALLNLGPGEYVIFFSSSGTAATFRVDPETKDVALAPPAWLARSGTSRLEVTARSGQQFLRKLWVGLAPAASVGQAHPVQWWRYAETWPRAARFDGVESGSYMVRLLDGAFGVRYGVAAVSADAKVEGETLLDLDVPR